MARLATASSHSTRVRTVEAAKTTAYWRRKAALVKSTLAVPLTASLSLPTIHAAASAQPRASEVRGSRASVGLGARVSLRPDPPALSPFSQYCFAGPMRRSHGSLAVPGSWVGVAPGVVAGGVGAA